MKSTWEVFVEEQLAPESTVSVMATLKKLKTPVFKTFDKKVKVKLKEKVVQVQSNCNFFAQLAIVASDRNIDMKDVIGQYELTATPKSFIDYDRQLHPGGEGKSKLVEVLTKFATGSKTIQRCGQVFNVAAVDAMQNVQNLTKSPDVKTFPDLAMVFCKEINERVFQSDIAVIAFDTYHQQSLKGATRSIRLGNKTPFQFVVNDAANIEDVTLKDILSHVMTKWELTTYFTEKRCVYLEERGQKYLIDGKACTGCVTK